MTAKGAKSRKPSEPADLRAPLRIGSDAEIAEFVLRRLRAAHGEVVSAEGSLWVFNGRIWQSLDEADLARRVLEYDGVKPIGKNTRRTLTSGSVNSVLQIIDWKVADESFFANPAKGICCESGFISFDSGKPELVPHDRAQRQRFVLPGRWPSSIRTERRLLSKLFTGIFKGDPERKAKIRVLRQLLGCVALGYGTRLTQQKAFFLIGKGASNGKSQYLFLLQAMVPQEAQCSTSISRLADERYIPDLAGKLLNAKAEIPNTPALLSEDFKSAVTGDYLEGRRAYGPKVRFKPIAQHVFAGNALPQVRGGYMDKGHLRRLLPIEFARTIPAEEQINDIGTRVAIEEPDALLAFAVRGAADLLRNKGFATPSSSTMLLRNWACLADHAVAFATDCIEKAPDKKLIGKRAYEAFNAWAEEEGIQSRDRPTAGVFYEQLDTALGASHGRGNSGVQWRGFALRRPSTKADE